MIQSTSRRLRRTNLLLWRNGVWIAKSGHSDRRIIRKYSFDFTDGREDFSLDIYRGRIRLDEMHLPESSASRLILVRVDLDGGMHSNPDGRLCLVRICTDTAKDMGQMGGTTSHGDLPECVRSVPNA